MRMLPFFKPKKGFMFAGGGLETSTGGGGGGGGGGSISYSTTETEIGTYFDKKLYQKSYVLSSSINITASNWVRAFPTDTDLAGAELVDILSIVSTQTISFYGYGIISDNALALYWYGTNHSLPAGTVFTILYAK